MAIVKYLPTTYAAASGTVTDPNNALTDASSDNYAVFTPPSSLFQMSCYFLAFNTSVVIPAGATLVSATVRVKMAIANGPKQYRCRASLDGSIPLGHTAYISIDSTPVVLEFPLDDTGKRYVNTNDLTYFRIYIEGDSSASRNTGAIIHVYGVEISAAYDAPINKVIVNKNGTPTTLIDLTSDTVSANKILSGYTAHDASGAIITGTYVPEIPSNYGLVTWDGSVLTVS